MAQSLREFMSEPWPHESPFDPNESKPAFTRGDTRLQIYAAFRGIRTSDGYGVIEYSTGNGYGRRGLHEGEHDVWIAFRAFVQGYLQATDGTDETWLIEAVRAEHARLRAVEEGRSLTSSP